MNMHFGRAVIAGLIGILLMTMVGLFAEPLMGLPPMNPTEMLAGTMGGSLMLGWAGHLMVGVILALGYAFVASALPGSGVARGAIYSIAPFLMAQVVVMPMMGMPLFSGSAAMAMGSLVGHMVYGAAVGGIYGEPTAVRVATA